MALKANLQNGTNWYYPHWTYTHQINKAMDDSVSLAGFINNTGCANGVNKQNEKSLSSNFLLRHYFFMGYCRSLFYLE